MGRLASGGRPGGTSRLDRIIEHSKGGCMVIRPLALGGMMGVEGRSVVAAGGKNGSAPLFTPPGDAFLQSGIQNNPAKLYSPSLMFKMMGRVELMVPESRTRF